MVVLDEAYMDLSNRESLVPLIGKYPNLVVLQMLFNAWVEENGWSENRSCDCHAGNSGDDEQDEVPLPY